MANEAQVQSGLRVLKRTGTVTQIDYNSRPNAFLATVTGTKGPLPGSITVSTSGTDLDLSGLSEPGLCRIMNQDGTNYVTLGIYDPTTGVFTPTDEFLPGESFVKRLPRFGPDELTGTGTLPGSDSVYRLVANTASVNVLVEAFER